MTDPDVQPPDPEVQPTDSDVQPTDSDVQLADSDVRAANPDSSARTGQATAPEFAPNGVVPAEESPEAAESDQQPVGDSLRAQLAGLDELDDLPVAEHIQRYEAVHNELHAALRGIHDPGD